MGGLRLLVVGGTGYLGRGVVPYLVREDHQVWVLARQKAKMADVTVIQGDALQVDWPAVLEGMDGVVNLVGIIREDPGANRTFTTMHVRLVERLVRAMVDHGPTRLVHVSALGSREQAVAAYHRTKWEAEQLIRAETAISATILRPSLIFGGGSPFFQTLAQMAGTPLGAMVPGPGTSQFDPIFRDDVAAMIGQTLRHEAESAGDTFEMGGPERFPLKALIAHVAKVRNMGPVAYHHLPLSWLTRAARVGQGWSWFPVTVDQLTMLAEDNITDDERWQQWVSPTPLGTDL